MHWFYGGSAQIRKAFGGPITGFRQPLQHGGDFPESIMALSSTGGAGRGASEGDIIGTVINHGKKELWKRGSGYHYHATLQAGEATLEGGIARLTMRSMAVGEGLGFLGSLQQEYVDFMTTPGSHNDAYASSYHRLFFQNRARGKPLHECPSNDGHNVDAIDGLVMPAVVLLGSATAPEAEAREAAQRTVGLTRSSRRVESYVGELSSTMRSILLGQPAPEVAHEAAARVGVRLDPKAQVPVVACYIEQNWASLLHLLAKHGDDLPACLLANANAGGENVHRGLVLGALVGAQVGARAIPDELKRGLRHSAEIEHEIARFVEARIGQVEACAA